MLDTKEHDIDHALQYFRVIPKSSSREKFKNRDGPFLFQERKSSQGHIS